MVFITVCRTIFYQFFLLFVGLSVGFILNAEWVGIKSLILERSMRNVFFPLKYDEKMERAIKEIGRCRVYIFKEFPKDFEILDENVYGNEEWYWCRYKYRDKNGKIKFDEGTTRIRWKTWEYYYESDFVMDTPENVKKEIERYKQGIDKRKKEIEKSKEREKELMNEEVSPEAA